MNRDAHWLIAATYIALSPESALAGTGGQQPERCPGLSTAYVRPGSGHASCAVRPCQPAGLVAGRLERARRQLLPGLQHLHPPT